MKSMKAVALGLLLLCILSSIAVPALCHGSHDDHDEDEFGEYDEFEMVGTAAPYIPPSTEQKETKKPETPKKKTSFDDEEFEGSAMGNIEFEKVPELKIDNSIPANPVVTPFAYNYLVEIGSIAFLVCFAVNYFIGRKTNEKIASSFARTFRDLFSSEFTTVGVNGAVLVKESQHTFRLNATGRANCIGIQANLRLVRRHDLVGLLYSKFWSPSRDLLDIQIALNPETIDTIVFALCKNRDARSISKDFSDLSSYTKTYKIPQENPKTESNLDNDVWTAMGESKELFSSLLDTASKTTLNRHKDAVRLVHVTDQYSEHKEYKKVLHMVFYLPEIEKLDDLRTLLLMTFHMIDHLARVKLTPAQKTTIEKARAKVVTDEKKEEMEAKKEELEAKKLEKRREQMKNMDANERAAFEEKERQRKMNKKMKKMTVKM